MIKCLGVFRQQEWRQNPTITFHANNAHIAVEDGSWWKVRQFCLTFHRDMPLTHLKGNITWKVNFGKVTKRGTDPSGSVPLLSYISYKCDFFTAL